MRIRDSSDCYEDYPVFDARDVERNGVIGCAHLPVDHSLEWLGLVAEI